MIKCIMADEGNTWSRLLMMKTENEHWLTWIKVNDDHDDDNNQLQS